MTATRRRWVLLAAVGTLAIVLAAVVLAGDDDPDVRLAATGPAPAGEVPPILPVAPPETTTTTTPAPVATSPPSTARRTDDPVVRTSTTVPSGSSSSPAQPSPSAPVPLPTTPAGAGCPASEVRLTVTTEKPAYRPGEIVRGSTTIENRSAGACLLPTRGFVRILNAAGKDVSSFAYTMEYRFPVSAEPGKTFSTPFTWDQKDCSGAACVQVPAGAYTVVADWTEGGPYSGRGSFSIG